MRALRDVLAARQLAPNTERSYRDGWARFEAWCQAAGRLALPADVETVELWAASELADGRALGSIESWLGGISHAHRTHGHQLTLAPVRRLLRGAERAGFARHPKRALELDLFRRLLELLRSRRFRPARSARDVAIFTFAFAGAFRRSELAALDLVDVVETPAGLAVTLRRSKTDQLGSGRVVGLSPAGDLTFCPVAAWRAWLAVRGPEPGPAFTQLYPKRGGAIARGQRLTGAAINESFKGLLRRAGVDPEPYGMHSYRAGMVTAAAAGGSSVAAIMARTGHVSVAMVNRYVRPASAFALDPMRGVL